MTDPIYLTDQRSRGYLNQLCGQGPVRGYLADLQRHHDDTYEHSLRVGLLSTDLGYENKVADADRRSLSLAGLLHDLGKTDIDETVLSKASSLGGEERKAIGEHPRRGFILLEEDLYTKVRRIVVGHHEYHMSAFPRQGQDRRAVGRGGDDDRRTEDATVEMLTQIVAVADMCDALASARPYKEPFSKAEIQATLSQQFTGDPVYVQQVLRRV